MPLMQAIVQDVYGTPDVLEARQIDRPTPDEGRVLVRVHAASVNPYDWHATTGIPLIARLGAGFRRPKDKVRGVDVAGTIEAVGAGVEHLHVGDEVFGGANGSFAEFACAKQTSLAAKPANLTFEQAAAVPMAGLTALQALRDKGRVQAGQRVLVNGAAGGVGTLAVQIAKARGAEVTAVCSTANVELVRALGADHVVDYTTDDFATQATRYDVLIDNVGNRSLADCRRVLNDQGVYVIISGPKKGRVLGPAVRMVRAFVRFAFAHQKAVALMAKFDEADLRELADLLAAGAITPVIDRTYQLADTPDALRYVSAGHAKGKVVITI